MSGDVRLTPWGTPAGLPDAAAAAPPSTRDRASAAGDAEEANLGSLFGALTTRRGVGSFLQATYLATLFYFNFFNNAINNISIFPEPPPFSFLFRGEDKQSEATENISKTRLFLSIPGYFCKTHRLPAIFSDFP